MTAPIVALFVITWLAMLLLVAGLIMESSRIDELKRELTKVSRANYYLQVSLRRWFEFYGFAPALHMDEPSQTNVLVKGSNYADRRPVTAGELDAVLAALAKAEGFKYVTVDKTDERPRLIPGTFERRRR